MSTIVYRISVLLSAILAEVPVGTNLGLFWLLWALGHPDPRAGVAPACLPAIFLTQFSFSYARNSINPTFEKTLSNVQFAATSENRLEQDQP
jgi:hypothetical protein